MVGITSVHAGHLLKVSVSLRLSFISLKGREDGNTLDNYSQVSIC